MQDIWQGSGFMVVKRSEKNMQLDGANRVETPRRSGGARRTSKAKEPVGTWSFFAFVYALSWPFWLIAIVLNVRMDTPAGAILGLLGLIGQKAAGLIAARYTYDRAQWRDYWRRTFDTKRISRPMVWLILLIVPITIGLAFTVDVLTGGSGAEWGPPALNFIAKPWTIIPFALLIFFVGPMEEFTWRGYVLDRLQARYNALVASLILGVAWSLWHLPLFYFAGSYHYGLGAGSAAFWQFMLGIIPLNVLFTWVYNNTNRSILAAMVLHFMMNFTAEMFDLTQRADLFWMVGWALVAIGLVVRFGPRTLTGRGGARRGQGGSSRPVRDRARCSGRGSGASMRREC